MKAIKAMATVLFFFVLISAAGAQEVQQYVSIPYELRPGKGAIHAASELTSPEKSNESWTKLIFIHESGKVFSGQEAAFLWKGMYTVLVPMESAKEEYKPSLVHIVPANSAKAETGKPAEPKQPKRENSASASPFSVVFVLMAGMAIGHATAHLHLRRLLSLQQKTYREQAGSKPDKQELLRLMQEIIHSPEFQDTRYSVRNSAEDISRNFSQARKTKPAPPVDPELEQFQKFIEQLCSSEEAPELIPMQSYRDGDSYVFCQGFEQKDGPSRFSHFLNSRKSWFTEKFPGYDFSIRIPDKPNFPRAVVQFFKTENSPSKVTN